MKDSPAELKQNDNASLIDWLINERVPNLVGLWRFGKLIHLIVCLNWVCHHWWDHYMKRLYFYIFTGTCSVPRSPPSCTITWWVVHRLLPPVKVLPYTLPFSPRSCSLITLNRRYTQVVDAGLCVKSLAVITYLARSKVWGSMPVKYTT